MLKPPCPHPCLLSPTGSYTLPLNRTPRTLADMEWDTVGRGADIELSSNCLTATKSSSAIASTVRGTILYADRGCHEFHVILDSLGPDGIWVGVASPNMDSTKCVGDVGCGWALHSDGDKRFNGREEEFTGVCLVQEWLFAGASAAAPDGCHVLLVPQIQNILVFAVLRLCCKLTPHQPHACRLLQARSRTATS